MSDALRVELAKPEYAGLSNQAAADRVNAKRVMVRRPVPTWRVRQEAIEQGYWPNLVEAQSSTTAAVRRLAVSILAWVADTSGTIQTIDMDRAATVQMRAGAVAAGLLTQEQADALAALANTDIPWTESVGLPEVGIGLVINARR